MIFLWQARPYSNYSHCNIQLSPHKSECCLESFTQNGQEKVKSREQENYQKMYKNDKVPLLLQVNDTTPPKLVAQTTKMLPWQSNTIHPHLKQIFPERRMMMTAARMNLNC